MHVIKLWNLFMCDNTLYTQHNQLTVIHNFMLDEI